jgi:hypothetical protein
MRIQFVKDDDGKIWLYYAKDIAARKIKFNDEKHLILKEVQQINNQAKKNLIKELNVHLNTAKSAKTIHGIYKVMDKHYDSIKDQAGIEEMLIEDPEITAHD